MAGQLIIGSLAASGSILGAQGIAFGSFTGLKDIKPEKDDQLFLTNGEEIIALPPTHSFVRSK